MQLDERIEAFGSHGRSAQNGLSAVPPNAIITIALTLIVYKLYEIVTDDHLVIKKITRCGEGFEKPNSGTTPQIRYIAKLSDGKIFEKNGYDGEDPFEFKVDEEQVIEGLDLADLAVSTMKRGEVAIIIINHEYGFGEIETNAQLGVVPARSTFYYEVEILGFTKVTESWDMEPDEKLEYAAKRKEEGNAYGKYQRAAYGKEMLR
ncbi:Peptidyl-prolyl cis-trans isomerase fkbp62 [Thalictrum thalictroides]|uniref:peptidylprolyl isomerase n=1 Tax=Thalictrum thalictroides TaxID=46969 RepID=A0A7J6V2I4_THATH|nr:Peptidyl-prolyl cis-trans isomerase fkbp62 [Thalictrum thalictroides]